MRKIYDYAVGNIVWAKDNRYVTILEILENKQYKVKYRDDNTEVILSEEELIPIPLSRELLKKNSKMHYCPVKDVFEIVPFGPETWECREEDKKQKGFWQIGIGLILHLHDLQCVYPDLVKEEDFDLK